MILSCHQPQYLPWLGYFDKIAKSDCFVFLDAVQYKPREYQNRNRIRSVKGWMWLSIPVISKSLGRQKICDVKIDNGFKWQNQHWGSLKSCYNKAPFFKEHNDFFKNVYTARWERLLELNVHIIKYLLKELGIDTPLYFESQVGTCSQGTERIIELCKKLKANVYLSGIGGKVYLEEAKFVKAGVKLAYQNFIHPKYRQQFAEGGHSFIANMSIIDLLFNEGKKSINILRGDFSYV